MDATAPTWNGETDEGQPRRGRRASPNGHVRQPHMPTRIALPASAAVRLRGGTVGRAVGQPRVATRPPPPGEAPGRFLPAGREVDLIEVDSH